MFELEGPPADFVVYTEYITTKQPRNCKRVKCFRCRQRSRHSQIGLCRKQLHKKENRKKSEMTVQINIEYLTKEHPDALILKKYESFKRKAETKPYLKV